MNHCRDPRVLVSLATTLFIFQAILPGATPQAANRSTADIVTAIAEDGNDLNAEKVIFFGLCCRLADRGENSCCPLKAV